MPGLTIDQHQCLTNSQPFHFLDILLSMSKKRKAESLSGENKKRIRQYSVDYLKFGFISDVSDATKPYCLVCCKSFCNDSMRPAKLEEHFKKVHFEQREKPLDHFERLRDQSLKTKEKSHIIQNEYHYAGPRTSCKL